VFLSGGSSKTLQKRFCKTIVSKGFTKKSTKNPKPFFSRFLFNHVFGRFSVRGVQKHHRKNRNQSDPGPFWASGIAWERTAQGALKKTTTKSDVPTYLFLRWAWRRKGHLAVAAAMSPRTDKVPPPLLIQRNGQKRDKKQSKGKGGK
jgi:hypothetical protein